MRPLRLNATVCCLTMLCLSILVAFGQRLLPNILLSSLCLGYLFLCRCPLKKLSLIFLSALPLAFGTWWSFYLFSTTAPLTTAWLYTLRLYTFLLLGCCLLLPYQLTEILFSLHLQLKLSATFVYGFLAAVNLLSNLQKQLARINYAAKMKGVSYHVFSPRLYLKLIVFALDQADALSQAMHSQGFEEGCPRTLVYTEKKPRFQWAISLFLIFCYTFLAFL
ncbi:energy-coupling factor transporter transmembrane component T [Ligilactobacillus faecis]|uniref:energy-coupling factor transporter transmembrane component T n=1 Tax=Ligilactobacillus faecis TaxID=762833 RepID=UPI002469A608|nr:energy-coupling factor transporter transmembrane component T [Ligilactobacillus faecis]WGN90452.1 energy-coupling factor transporter transmembrane component T [Ligilactobacillus faecis]